MRENDTKRSRKRRKARALNVPAARAIEDFPIAKGGRYGRPKLEQVIQALQEGDMDHMREVLRHFDQVPQPLSAYLLAVTISDADAKLRESRTPTSILSAEGRRTIFRSFWSRAVTDQFLSDFSTRVSRFAEQVKLPHSYHTCRKYGYFNFGMQHAYGNNNNASEVNRPICPMLTPQVFQMPGRVEPHRTHKEAADALLMSPEFKELM